MKIGHYVGIHGQRLNSYVHSTGGGMRGGFYRLTVRRQGDKALISFEKAESFNQKPEIEEYFIDAAVLDELGAAVKKYRMNFWNRKKFTHMFVSDGESKSYSFEFDKESVSFSSQIYPGRYRKKLKSLESIISKYASRER